MAPPRKTEGEKPNNHRYLAGFQRDLELYGGLASHLQEQASLGA